MKKEDENINSHKGELPNDEDEELNKEIDENNDEEEREENNEESVPIDFPEKSLIHSSKGEYTSTNRHRSGGHGQEAIEYMREHAILYKINIEYKNGVRVGNISESKEKMKQKRNIQT